MGIGHGAARKKGRAVESARGQEAADDSAAGVGAAAPDSALAGANREGDVWFTGERGLDGAGLAAGMLMQARPQPGALGQLQEIPKKHGRPSSLIAPTDPGVDRWNKVKKKKKKTALLTLITTLTVDDFISLVLQVRVGA